MSPPQPSARFLRFFTLEKHASVHTNNSSAVLSRSSLLADFGMPQGSVLGGVHFTGVRALI